MCWLVNLFHKPKILILPHPEEAMNSLTTVDMVDLRGEIEAWYSEWQVPATYWSFWDSVSITLVDNLYCVINGEMVKVPAFTYADTKEMYLDPQWDNPGVIAHEMAHISYYLLNMTDKIQFEIAYREELKKNALLKFLYSQKPYMKTDILEAHADIYRYLGDKMPQTLKTFYPNMF